MATDVDHATAVIWISLPEHPVPSFEWYVFDHIFRRTMSPNDYGQRVAITADRSADGHVWVSDTLGGTWTDGRPVTHAVTGPM